MGAKPSPAFGLSRTPAPTKDLHRFCHTDRAKRVERISIRVVGDADPYGCAENQYFAFKGPLAKGAGTEGDWGIRVRITHNLNISYFLALSPLPCFARLPPLKRGALNV